ncbi:hypothetical protein BP00DRAFT_300828, partial [Aspergillus indologenus CBS 114.80]
REEVRTDGQTPIIPSLQLHAELFCELPSLGMRRKIIVCAVVGHHIRVDGDAVQFIQKRIDAFCLRDDVAFSYVAHLTNKGKQPGTVRGNQISLLCGARQLARTDVLQCPDSGFQIQHEDLRGGGVATGRVGFE